MGGVGGKDAAPPTSLMEVFQLACPKYMAMGMSYSEYWDGETSAHRAYREAKKLLMSEANQLAWLQGLYVYEAIGALAPALKAFAKGKVRPYVKEPHELFADEVKEREEREARERYERIKAKVEQFAREQKEKRSKDFDNKEVDVNAGCIT